MARPAALLVLGSLGLSAVTFLAVSCLISRLDWRSLTRESPAAAQVPRRVETDFLALQKAWQGKFGKGNVTFMVRHINYHGSLPHFNYMFPWGEKDHQTLNSDDPVLEPFVSLNLAQDVWECCADGGHFVDVGGNFGWYSLLAASMGCKVDVFEPVPWFSLLLSFNSAGINEASVGARITARYGKVLGSKPGGSTTVTVPLHDITGMASVGSADVGGDGPTARIQVEMTSLDQELVIGGQMAPNGRCAMKIDVEGFEPDVIEGSDAFLSASVPKVTVIELSPGMQHRHGRGQEANLKMLDRLAGLGYVAHHLDWGLIKSKRYDVINGTSMASRRFNGSSQALIEKCGWNCMVYFVRP